MLIEFRVENHRSLRDEQALTFAAGRIGDPADQRLRTVAGCSDKLLPAAVVYGANASGKSNVLTALTFMRDAVLFSHRRWDPDGGVPRSAFAWGERRGEPSTFEVSFLLDNCKYEYGFSTDDVEVAEEWLFAWPKGRKQVWFERDRGHFTYGENLHGPNEAIREATRPNALFLSTAAQFAHGQLGPLFTWFRAIVPVNIPGHRFSVFHPAIASGVFRQSKSNAAFPLREESEETLVPRVRRLLNMADTGIVDVRKTVSEIDSDDSDDETFAVSRIQFQHQAGNDESWLDFREESEGTKTLFRMSLPLIHVLESGGVLLVDELEASLHPLLGLAILRMFNSSDTNPLNAQILSTAHDTNLLGTTLGKPELRRDQIWFTEKDEEGATNLYPLTDYKPRNVENLERGYLQGRYGAIPFLGDLIRATE